MTNANDKGENTMNDHMNDMKELGHADWAAGGYSVGTYGIVAVARISELEAALGAILEIPNSEAAQGIMKVFAHEALKEKTP